MHLIVFLHLQIQPNERDFDLARQFDLIVLEMKNYTRYPKSYTVDIL